jgi:Uncharacterised nucleotidyltransferase
MRDARLLAWVLAQPSRALTLSAQNWTALLAIAHGERLAGSLAVRLEGLAIPPEAARFLDRARKTAEGDRTTALWEAEMARRALAPLGIPVILLKGAAFVAAGLDAGRGRQIGDLDILVPRERLDDVEAALLGAGWEWVKPDPYDDAYYRDHMHELPPLIHRERDRMIDVHHTILPLTARVTPDAESLIAESVALKPSPLQGRGLGEGTVARPATAPSPSPSPEGEGGLRTLSSQDMLLHAVAHLFADGDLAGGMRNLWDIDRLVREQSDAPDYWKKLHERSAHHSLTRHLSRALRLARHLYETPVDDYLAWQGRRGDVLYLGRLLARNGWGQENRKLLRFGFYLRSHWLRMPPLMLARHLWTKWRKG